MGRNSTGPTDTRNHQGGAAGVGRGDAGCVCVCVCGGGGIEVLMEVGVGSRHMTHRYWSQSRCACRLLKHCTTWLVRLALTMGLKGGGVQG